MRELLKGVGYKATPARLAILEIFSKSKVPLDAESVYKKLRKTRKNINEVTIYRTLSSLMGKGILKKVDLRKNSTFFELAREHHHHIVCTNCDTVEDFKNLEVEKAIKKILKHNFINIKEHSLELFGLCARCV
jgi:Fur family transcriptional regulator, ferric uptake regulator